MYQQIVNIMKPLAQGPWAFGRISLVNLNFGFQARTYKAPINIEWVPPPILPSTHPSKSGDRGTLPQVDLSRPQFKFSRHNPRVLFTDREDVAPEIRRLATLEFAPHSKKVQIIKQDSLGSVQRHTLDCSSMESKIACLTITIRNLQRHIEKWKKDTSSKILCKEKIEYRNSLLKHLRRMDYKRFEWLLEKLDLVYHSLPNPIVPVTRKGSINKITTIYCEKIRNDRLEAYKKELEQEKITFKEEKERLLKWIDQEEKELGLKS